jgi:hypothetical protein
VCHQGSWRVVDSVVSFRGAWIWFMGAHDSAGGGTNTVHVAASHQPGDMVRETRGRGSVAMFRGADRTARVATNGGTAAGGLYKWVGRNMCHSVSRENAEGFRESPGLHFVRSMVLYTVKAGRLSE